MPIHWSSLQDIADQAGFSPAHLIQSLLVTEGRAEFTLYSIDPVDGRPSVGTDGEPRTFTWSSRVVGDWRTPELTAPDIAAVAAALVMHRRHLGLSRSQVADRMGSTKSNVRWIERNMLDAELDAIYRYARALDLRLTIQVEADGADR